MPEYVATHQPCSKCGSSDGKSYFKDGGSKCHVCSIARKKDPENPINEGEGMDIPMRAKSSKPKAKYITNLDTIASLPTMGIPSRGLDEAICKMFGIKVELSTANREPVAVYMPYFDDAGTPVAYKWRPLDRKDFRVAGELPNSTNGYGWQRVRENAQLLILAEGEYDAMAATQMLKKLGKNYGVVSPPNGASSAKEWAAKNMEKLSKAGKIIIAFDRDKAGQKAAKEVAEILPPGKAYIMQYPEDLPDANDILLKGRPMQFLDAINQAKEFRPDGIVASLDTWEVYKNRPEVHSYPWPESWKKMNEMTYGIRLSELDVITSGTSAGKTQLMREIVFHLVKSTDLTVGVLSLEEPIGDTIESYLGLQLNKRIHLPDVKVSEEDEYEAWKATFGTGRLHLYYAFGGEESSVMGTIRYMAQGMGCQAIVLDHLHMLLDGKDSEKEQIERMMLTLKKLTQQLGVWIGLIAHLKKSQGSSFEEGGIANLDDLKGSSSIKQLANGAYVLARDQQAEDNYTRNCTEIYVKKCRFTGRTGHADTFHFDDDTGRMNVVQPDDLPF